MAESDLIYTETLMQRGKIDYTGKRILVLGAGDGALLWELLKENPGMVTMVEVCVSFINCWLISLNVMRAKLVKVCRQ